MSLVREAERCLANRTAYAKLNAFIAPPQQAESWRGRVAEAEARRETGQLRSRLDGKLIAIKDNICTQESTTTCASKILSSFTSPFKATVVQRLEDAGAVVAGKTNMDEFGMGFRASQDGLKNNQLILRPRSHSLNSHFGRVVNHMNADKEAISAGGSSGGSAVAVATDQCYA
ncbi:Trimeric GatFAB AmidoTransferase(AdT) complex subunit, partial [Ascosphaera pollenicola]